MKRHIGLIALVAVSLGAAARDVTGLAVAQGAERPVLQFRIEGRHTESDEAWAKTFGMLKECPGLCDEVWFGTGFGMPTPEKHREYAARIGGASKDVASLGWKSGLQIQATIGHGGPFCAGYDYSGRNWTGWTGSTGVEDKYCSCPRDPRFLAYMCAVARIYAANHPASVWIDDDLRIALLGLRLDEQGPVRLRLRSVPENAMCAVWREIRREPVALPIHREGGICRIEVPSIGAWNGGFLEF